MSNRKRKSERAPEGRDCIVCDVGSGFIKIGLASDLIPSIVAPTVVGRPVVRDHARYSRHIVNELASENSFDEYMVLRKPGDEKGSSNRGSDNIYVGQEARDSQSFLDLSRPVEKGIVKNWDELERIFSHFFSSLRNTESESRILTPSNKRPVSMEQIIGGSVVLTDMVSGIPQKQREKLIEMMFETFSFNRVNISASAALVLASRGATSGLVLDVGDTKTEIVPVVSGFMQKSGIKISDLGGRTVTDRFIDLLKRSDSANYKLDKDRDFFLLERAKENYCYIASDLGEERYIAETTGLLSQQLTLPDKTVVMNAERFMAGEIFFEPRFLGDPDRLGLPALVNESIQNCAIDNRQMLSRSVVLAGGATLMPGFARRLSKELGHCVDESPTRQFSAFNGGCVMAQTSENNGWWIEKREFKEKGAAACVQRLFASAPK